MQIAAEFVLQGHEPKRHEVDTSDLPHGLQVSETFLAGGLRTRRLAWVRLLLE